MPTSMTLPVTVMRSSRVVSGTTNPRSSAPCRASRRCAASARWARRCASGERGQSFRRLALASRSFRCHFVSDGIALFEATHGTAPRYAGLNQVNPGSIILSAVMMLLHLGWKEAADIIVTGIEKSILNQTVTYDFERQMKGATLVSCSGFGEAIIGHL